MDLEKFVFQDTVARHVRKFADKTNQEIQELDYLACLYADQRDAYKEKLEETQKTLAKYQKSLRAHKKCLDDANAQIVQMNKSYTEMKEYAEERNEGCEALSRLSRERGKIIDAKNAELKLERIKRSAVENSYRRSHVTSSLDDTILKHEDVIRGLLEEMKEKATDTPVPVSPD